MSSATLDDRDAGAGGRNRTRVGGVQVRCTTAVRRQPGAGCRSRTALALYGSAVSPRDVIRPKCDGRDSNPHGRSAPRNLSPRCLPVPNHRRVKCRGRDSNPHGRSAPPGLGRRCLPVPKHHGLRVGLGGGDRTHVVLLPKQAGQPLPYTQRRRDGAGQGSRTPLGLLGRQTPRRSARPAATKRAASGNRTRTTALATPSPAVGPWPRRRNGGESNSRRPEARWCSGPVPGCRRRTAVPAV